MKKSNNANSVEEEGASLLMRDVVFKKLFFGDKVGEY